MGTSIARIDPADRRPQSVPREPAAPRSGMILVTGKFSGLSSRMSEKKKSFHTHMNWRTAAEARAGIAIGNTIFENILKSPAPGGVNED